jgi:hypothetical protein
LILLKKTTDTKSVKITNKGIIGCPTNALT